LRVQSDRIACDALGLLQRQTVQFHWENRGLEALMHFWLALSQEKRKKIKQERRRVAEAGVTFRCLHGNQIQTEDWDFFYRCYERTYLEHGNAPYLKRAFLNLCNATCHTTGYSSSQSASNAPLPAV
jgi:predicted N-acyltransferase